MPYLEVLGNALSLLTVEQLKRHLKYFEIKKLPTKKSELVSLLEKQLLKPDVLQHLWESLSPEQRQIVSFIIHQLGGLYEPEMIKSRLGFFEPIHDSPYMGLINQFLNKSNLPSAYEMLFYPHAEEGLAMPKEMWDYFYSVVPEPAKPLLQSYDELPSVLDIYEIRLYDESDAATTPEELFPVAQAATERAVFHDLNAILQLIDQGKVGISNRTRQPSLATIKLLAKQLLISDYININYRRAEDCIRPFALVMLVQIAKWATLSTSSASKLELTKRGRALLSTQLGAEHIRELWQAWVKDNSLEPLTRVPSIHGINSLGTRLTKPSQRRKVIEDMMQQFPIGRWITTQHLFTWVRSMGYDLSVEQQSNYSTMYIGYSVDSGWLGYSHINYWEALIGSYLLVELCEYVSTMGVIEIATIDPETVFRPISDRDMLDLMFGDEPFSRYEGLFAFRITELGRYVLGLTPTYTPPTYDSETSEPLLTVLPNLEVVITNQAVSTPIDIAMLERMAVPKSDHVYQLQRNLVMESVTNGLPLERITQFLLAKSGQSSFPPLIQSFFDDIARRLDALREGGRMIVFEGDRYLLTELANLSALRKFAQLATIGERTVLLVPEEHETAVRRQFKKQGYTPRKA